MPLPAKRQRFVQEYRRDRNATQAAIRAGYSPKSAGTEGYRLLKDAEIVAEIQRLDGIVTTEADITKNKVLQRLWAIATANPNALVQFRRVNCRHCWGVDGGYQWTEAEYLMACDAAVRADKSLPDDAGGYGYIRTRAANPECCVCCGEGVGEMHALDTRHLRPEDLVLYAGAKQTQHGLEIKLHDQMAALVNVARAIGLFDALPKPKDGESGAPAADNDRPHRIPGLLKYRRAG